MPNSPCSPRRALRLQTTLDRIADVRGDVVEIGLAVRIPAHAIAVVLDAQIVLAVLPATRDGDRFARASMLFSTSSAMAFSGLLCDSAMIVMAFQ